jgi:fatty-acyl-CoA synthase
MLINAPAGRAPRAARTVEFLTAGAPPPAAGDRRHASAAGFRITHVYGLTEVYGPAVVCAWQAEWDDLPAEEQAG